MATDNRTNEMYQINTALTNLATEMGIPFNQKWEDEVLNDLVHSVHAAFEKARDYTPVVTESIRSKTSRVIRNIIHCSPGAWGATRGKSYSDIDPEVRSLSQVIRILHGQPVALMFLNMHGLDAGRMSTEDSLEFSRGHDLQVTVPDFSEYGEGQLVAFYQALAALGIIPSQLLEEILRADS